MKMIHHIIISICFGFGLTQVAVSESDATSANVLTFEKDIRPILKAHCFHCHGEGEKTKGGLDLRLRRKMIKGGKSGAVIQPGEPEKSLLYEALIENEMPPEEVEIRPSSAEINIIKRWIVQGAKTARPEPESVPKFTYEEKNYWAFQPVMRVAVPEVKSSQKLYTPIDAFIVAKLKAHQLDLSSPIGKRKLIRRVTFDLTGLPPTPEETDAFVNDKSPDAYEKLIDGLLGRPAYGERWARHWLDVAGYAESNSNGDNEIFRPYAYRYRDYVIKSFNDNKRIDEFIVEQLAGDELVKQPADLKSQRTIELYSATGFLRMAPDTTQESNTLVDRNQAVAESIKVLSSSLLGLSVGCAQCHDHRYDPISQEDYYKLRAIFDPALNVSKWKQPSERLIDVTPAEVVKKINEIDAEANKRQEALNKERNALGKQIQNLKIMNVPEADREQIIVALNTPANKQTNAQKDLLQKYPMVRDVPRILGLLIEYDRKSYDAFTKKQAEINAFRGTKPQREMIMVLKDVDLHPESRLFSRGDPEQPKQVVEYDIPEIIRLNVKGNPLKVDKTLEHTSGRRLGYARWLTSGEHPLVARVIVNRVWMHHFGKGLVATPGEFGYTGDRPSHPELLDWLADEFVKSGWDLKSLHRLIMKSAVYRQSSMVRSELAEIDPDNRLLGRMNLRRLDAESLRDTMYFVSGKLNMNVGGPSEQVKEDGEGRIIVNANVKEAMSRRSIYVQSKRKMPLSMLESFDLPTMSPNCDARQLSTAATQSLMLLNDDSVTVLANQFAIKIYHRDKSHTENRISEVYSRLFNEPPSAEELQWCKTFLDEQVAYYKAVPDHKLTAEQISIQALTNLIHTLFCTNRFLYID